MAFTDQLKKARLSMGLTQQQIADMMGITKSTYCGYETGKRQPDVAKIKKLASILNTSGDILLETGFTPQGTINNVGSAKTAIALDLFRALRPEFQDYALEQMKQLIALQEKR